MSVMGRGGREGHRLAAGLEQVALGVWWKSRGRITNITSSVLKLELWDIYLNDIFSCSTNDNATIIFASTKYGVDKR